MCGWGVGQVPALRHKPGTIFENGWPQTCTKMHQAGWRSRASCYDSKSAVQLQCHCRRSQLFICASSSCRYLFVFIIIVSSTSRVESTSIVAVESTRVFVLHWTTTSATTAPRLLVKAIVNAAMFGAAGRRCVVVSAGVVLSVHRRSHCCRWSYRFRWCVV